MKRFHVTTWCAFSLHDTDAAVSGTGGDLSARVAVNRISKAQRF